VGEAGNTSDQEFLLKEEKLLLWVSSLPFLRGICIALTAMKKCSTLSCGRSRWWKHRWCGEKTRHLSSGVLATDCSHCSGSVLGFIY